MQRAIIRPKTYNSLKYIFFFIFYQIIAFASLLSSKRSMTVKCGYLLVWFEWYEYTITFFSCQRAFWPHWRVRTGWRGGHTFWGSTFWEYF